MGTIIGNKSEGHNYHYANLADIARQGIEIPPMRVAPVFDNEGRIVAEYIEAKIGEEWIRLENFELSSIWGKMRTAAQEHLS